LLARLLPPLMILFAAGAALSYGLAVHYANLVYDAWLFDSVSSLAIQVRKGEEGPTLDLPEAAKRVFVWDVSDVTSFKVSGDHSGLIAGRAELPVTPKAAESFRNARVFDAMIDGRSVRVASLILPADVYGEAITVEVSETRSKRNALATQILLSLLLPQLLLIGVAAITIREGVRSGLRPLITIAARIAAQSHSRITVISDSNVPKELRPVTYAIDELLGRLDHALNAQRRFIANAAHQLRTPITALKLNIEQAQQASSFEEVRPFLERLRLSSERATRLTQQLLMLARAEPNAVEPDKFENFDLRQLVFDAGAEWVPIALKHGVEMSFSSDQDRVPAKGNPLLVQEALNNLLDNAIRYHRTGGTVEISVFSSPSPGFSITDDGPGIPARDLQFAFQRFRRGDAIAIDGSGLGLAIVKEIATSHRGSVSLENRTDGRGLRARFEFGAD
jgi:two-component system, OmpR family, sensor histidine kinase TctE